MNYRHFIRAILTIPLLSFTVTLASSTPPAVGHPDKSTHQSSAQATAARTGYPGRRMGGGSRDHCQSHPLAITSIVPPNNLVLTTATQPKLLFYVAGGTAPQTAEFVLRDSKDREVYSAFMEIPTQSGFISIDLATLAAKSSEMGKSIGARQDQSTLALNEDYRWYFSILCSPDNRSADIGVDGWIRRVALTAQAPGAGVETINPQALAQIPPLERAQALLDRGLWHDALVLLSELRADPNTNPILRQKAENQWEELVCDDPDLVKLATATMTLKTLYAASAL